ncbi:MAG: rhodanese-like domain-containing protein [Chloroflexi bacterium]|nr:rhodanese-like domain-containing protein [Chloroflexota bacterium]
MFGSSTVNITPAEAQARLRGSQPPFLLDVRQPEEFRAGHIAGAKLIPLDQLSARLHELPRDREILCVCRSGSRSGVAARQLASAGFTSANLGGGMIAWQRAGLPVKPGK